MDDLRDDTISDIPIRSLKIKNALCGRLYTVNIKHNCHVGVCKASTKDRFAENTNYRHNTNLNKCSLKFSLPYPISDGFKVENDLKDECQELMKVQELYHKKLAYVKSKYKKSIPSIKKTVENMEEITELPQYLVNLTQLKNVDPYFINEGKYDYYFTGGSLNKLKFKADEYLLSVRFDNNLFLHRNEQNYQLPYNTEDKKTIYSIRGSHFKNATYFTIRRKFSAEINKICKDSKRNFRIEKIYKTKDCIKPFVDLKHVNASTLITLSAMHQLIAVDLEKGKKKFEKFFDYQRSSAEIGALAQLEPLSENTLFFNDTHSVAFYDLISNELVKKHEVDKGFFKCNDLCLSSLSKLNDNYVYVASKHSIFKIDLREMKVVHQWQHLLENSPISMRISKSSGDEELLFISSFREIACLQVNSYKNYLPFKIPTAKDTKNALNLQGEFFLSGNLENRLNYSLNGLEVSENSVYSGNSLGDIYKSTFNDLANSDESINRFCGWINKLEQPMPVLKANTFKNMNFLKRQISLEPLTKENEDILKIYKRPKRGIKKFLNPAKEFAKYDMFSIWESPRVDLDLENLQDSKIGNDSRINSWLQQTEASQFEPLDIPEFLG